MTNDSGDMNERDPSLDPVEPRGSMSIQKNDKRLEIVTIILQVVTISIILVGYGITHWSQQQLIGYKAVIDAEEAGEVQS